MQARKEWLEFPNTEMKREDNTIWDTLCILLGQLKLDALFLTYQRQYLSWHTIPSGSVQEFNGLQIYDIKVSGLEWIQMKYSAPPL